MALPADKRINLTSSHRLGLTNEGDYSVVDVNADEKISNILKDILFDEGTGAYLYPEVGDTLNILPFPLPILYSMGIHSLCKFLQVQCLLLASELIHSWCIRQLAVLKSVQPKLSLQKLISYHKIS